mgnify:CR=1 FL=1
MTLYLKLEFAEADVSGLLPINVALDIIGFVTGVALLPVALLSDSKLLQFATEAVFGSRCATINCIMPIYPFIVRKSVAPHLLLTSQRAFTVPP